MNNGVMLNAYPDSMGGTLGDIAALLHREEMAGTFCSFYILPSVFNTDLDRGFSVISYDLNHLLARQEDIESLKNAGLDLKLDFILNHLSVLSPQFQDILQKGDKSEYRDFFIDWNKFWEGHGTMTEEGYLQPDAALIQDMFFRKPGLPILMVRFPDGRNVPYWNTFYQEVRYPQMDPQDLMQALNLQYGEAEALAKRLNAATAAGKKPADADFAGFESCQDAAVEVMESRRHYLGQMDLNLRSPLVWAYYDQVLKTLADYGASIVRLDAFAYAPKTPGLRNFMNEPDTWDTLEKIRQLAEKYHLTLLPEIHAAYSEHSYQTLTDKGYMTYDFFLPGLIIDAIEHHDGHYLKQWAEEQQEKGIRAVNMLGCHDGIPLLDLKGLIPEARIQSLIDLVVERGGMIKNLHGQKNVYYQVNATYYSALGADDKKMLLARALQLFMPGKPQVWYLDLFAGENDLAAVQRAGAAGHKEINRTNLSKEDIDAALKKPIVQKQLELLRFRNACPAFGEKAELKVETSGEAITFTWCCNGCTAKLTANLATYDFQIEA